jgi:hypothetical protein
MSRTYDAIATNAADTLVWCELCWIRDKEEWAHKLSKERKTKSEAAQGRGKTHEQN